MVRHTGPVSAVFEDHFGRAPCRCARCWSASARPGPARRAADGRVARGGRHRPAGDGARRLPSTRALATDLGVSRGVVVDAYEQLVAEGRLVARHGSGTTVAARPAPSPPAPSRHPGRWARPAPLRPGVPDLAMFPRARGRRAYDQALAWPSTLSWTTPTPPVEPRLRASSPATSAGSGRRGWARTRRRHHRRGPGDELLGRVLAARGMIGVGDRGSGQRLRGHLFTPGLRRAVPVPADGRELAVSHGATCGGVRDAGPPVPARRRARAGPPGGLIAWAGAPAA